MRREPRKNGERTTAKKVQQTEDKPYELPSVQVKPEGEEGPWDEQGLTERQKRFVFFFMGEAAGNATQAASLAGYSDDNNAALRVTACRLLTYPNVQRAIGRERGRRFGSLEDVKAGIAEIANGSAADFLETAPDGSMHVSLERMAEAGALGTLQQVQEETIKSGENVSTLKVKVKLYDRLRALETLAKMNGQLKENVEHTGTLYVKQVDGVNQSDL